jgi:hypothetical protein
LVNGDYRLMVNADGVLALYDGKMAANWTADYGTIKPTGDVACVLQGDANFVCKDSQGQVVFNTKTDGKYLGVDSGLLQNGKPKLSITKDGILQVRF